MHSFGSHSLYELISSRAIPSDKCTKPFASEIQYLTRKFELQSFKFREDVGADLACMLDKIEALNLVVDGIEEKYPRRVANPGVVSASNGQYRYLSFVRLVDLLSITLRWADVLISIVIPSCLCLFGERDDIRR